jgi:hypothetical protein
VHGANERCASHKPDAVRGALPVYDALSSRNDKVNGPSVRHQPHNERHQFWYAFEAKVMRRQEQQQILVANVQLPSHVLAVSMAMFR